MTGRAATNSTYDPYDSDGSFAITRENYDSEEPEEEEEEEAEVIDTTNKGDAELDIMGTYWIQVSLTCCRQSQTISSCWGRMDDANRNKPWRRYFS